MAGELRDRYGVDVADLPGARGGRRAGRRAGRAGGPARARLRRRGRRRGLADRLARADLVVTGEGRLDASSWSGKVVGGVVRGLARTAGVPVLVVPGAVGPRRDRARGRRPGAVPGVEVRSLTDRFGEARALGRSRRLCGGGRGAPPWGALGSDRAAHDLTS